MFGGQDNFTLHTKCSDFTLEVLDALLRLAQRGNTAPSEGWSPKGLMRVGLVNPAMQGALRNSKVSSGLADTHVVLLSEVDGLQLEFDALRFFGWHDGLRFLF